MLGQVIYLDLVDIGRGLLNVVLHSLRDSNVTTTER